MGGDYAFFIWSAYGVTGMTVAALILRAVLDHRAQTRALARLQARPDPASGTGDARPPARSSFPAAARG